MRRFGDRDYLLELPIRGDFALVHAWKADTWGNLVFRKTAANFNPMMCAAARVCIVEAEHIVEVGAARPRPDPRPVHLREAHRAGAWG